MQVKDVITYLARKARLTMKGKSDNKLLRFRKGNWHLSFVINNTGIIGSKWISPPGFKNPSLIERFDICNPGSLTRILAFMSND